MNLKCPLCKQNTFVSTEEVHRSEIPDHIYILAYRSLEKPLKNAKPWWFCSSCNWGPPIDYVPGFETYRDSSE